MWMNQLDCLQLSNYQFYSVCCHLVDTIIKAPCLSSTAVAFKVTYIINKTQET